nr:adenylate/guanylate cyclase domain-containing protein [Fundidesulfovibrio terrae]
MPPGPFGSPGPLTSGTKRSTYVIPLLAGVLLAVVAVLFCASPPRRQLESQLFDAFFLLRGPRPAPADLVIVAIDEPSIKELGLAWPWPRRVHAELLRRLSRAGAGLVMLDVVFAEPSPPEDDQALEDAIRDNGRVILASTLDRVEDPAFSRLMLVEPLPRFRNATLDTGLAMLTPDPDGTIRSFVTRLSGQPTLPSAALAHLQTGPTSIPQGGLVNHLGPPRTIRTISYTQVLDDAHPLPPHILQGKIVLVGRSLAAQPDLAGQADSFRTPFSHDTGLNTSGVELHATILSSLLSGRTGTLAPRWSEVVAAFLLLPCAALLLARMRPLAGFLTSAAMAAGVVGFSYVLFAAFLVWFPALFLSVGVLAAEGFLLLDGYMRTSRERRRIRLAFSRYVSPAVVDMLLARPELLEPGGEEVEATVLFSDLAGFTSFSELMAPGELMTVLSEYFTPMTAIIKENSGTLDKFIGDAIMAFWGAPLRDNLHAPHACRAALGMERALKDLRDQWEAQGVPGLYARIGIHSGKVVAGNVGSREQVNYTCLGDTVNLASRLESVNKLYGTGILVSGETRTLLGSEFILRPVDAIRVKGRAKPVEIFELVGLSEPQPQWAVIYEKGLQAYRTQDFGRAQILFAQVLEQKTKDGPSTVMLDRCRSFALTPPGPEWDAVHVMESK